MDPAEQEALDLRESSVSLVEAVDGEGAIQKDGSVLLHVIRPGLGRGRGRHLYEASMLEKNAHKFGKYTREDGTSASGWKMYVNHLSPEAKRAAGGLPRDVQDLGGRIVESWWDPNVPPSGRFGKGAVVGRCKPTPFISALIENDPEIIEASISATATGVRRGEAEGQPCWVVEGIEDRGSVDWVTEAGAGGRVVALMEAAYETDTDGRVAVLSSMSDDEFRAYLTAERPEIAEAMSKGSDPEDTGPGGDGGKDELQEQIDKLMKKGMGKAQATAMAKNIIAKAKSAQESEEDEMTDITPELLSEALQDEDNRALLIEALDLSQVVQESVSATIDATLPTLVEAAVSAERDIIRATARADADRRVQIERMRSAAHEMVEATTLPRVFKDEVKGKFTLTESGDPTPALNVVDEIDEDGEVAKKAEDKLKEAVESEIGKARDLYAAANPTRVRGQGPSATDGDEPTPEQRAGVTKGGLMESLLQESGFSDPTKVYEETALQG